MRRGFKYLVRLGQDPEQKADDSREKRRIPPPNCGLTGLWTPICSAPRSKLRARREQQIRPRAARPCRLDCRSMIRFSVTDLGLARLVPFPACNSVAQPVGTCLLHAPVDTNAGLSPGLSQSYSAHYVAGKGKAHRHQPPDE
ncbi:hypothetical protein EYF80_012740 [Liparis tanakae]|uniref:Uncharacterized protein n=1 Tax=Liparis tanakae TaxID=230148 RepID=A0A4Z2IIG5_9TELE|nr:hypothetical protein EYF80_012740 [Liparis tanakae]